VSIVVADLVFVSFSVGSVGFGTSFFVVSNLRSIQGIASLKKKMEIATVRRTPDVLRPLASIAVLRRPGSRFAPSGPAHLRSYQIRSLQRRQIRSGSLESDPILPVPDQIDKSLHRPMR
jgi:hypothetical protein